MNQAHLVGEGRSTVKVSDIKEKLLRCVKKLETNEREIIQNDINERTIAH